MSSIANTTETPRPAVHSLVLEHAVAEPEEARRYFAAKLAVETDPYDVSVDLERGTGKIIVVDARSPRAYLECHIPGAVSLPHRAISVETTATLPRDAVIVTYCAGPNCNASTKAALKLAALGFRVKEMIGGLQYWRLEGLPVDGTLGDKAPLYT